MPRKITKREDMLADLKETQRLLNQIPEDAPERPMLEKMAVYERRVIQECDVEDWDTNRYYQVKTRYLWR